jgi:proteic killer suppression protein
VIKSFADKDTRALFEGRRVRRFHGFERQAIRRLQILEDAETIHDLMRLPANHFEALKGDRAGQYSIRINLQWRLCFRFENGEAHDVEIADYH